MSAYVAKEKPPMAGLISLCMGRSVRLKEEEDEV